MTASLFKSCARAAIATFGALLASFALAPPASAQALIRDAEIEDTLRVYCEPIWQAAGLRGNEIHIYIVNDPSINAFVSNGQNIFIHTGLILSARNPNELIGVLAHESGHIAGGHIVRSREAMRQSLGPALISIGLGVLAIAAGAPQAGSMLIAGSQSFAMGNYVRFSQVQESAADQAAAEYLEASGQSGRGLVTFFNHNIRPYEFMMRRAPPWVLSHPFSSDRVESLRQRVEAGSNRDAVDTEENLRRFTYMQAKLVGFLRNEGRTLARYPLTDTSAPARYARAIAYYRAANLPSARRELDTLLVEQPNNPYFLELMGQILFDNGHAQESIAYHRRSLEAAPNQALFQINLARALNASGGRAGADEAAELLQQALVFERDNAFAWRELAQSRDIQGQEGLAELASAEQNYAIGDYRAALNFAERARRTLPHNTPSFQYANDIVGAASEEIRKAERNAGGRRT